MKRFIFAVCLIVLCGCAKDVYDLTGDIQGIVKDYQDGHSIKNCQVSLIPSGKTTVTDNQGVFYFNRLTPGEYTLAFSKAGYVEESKKVVVVSGQITESTLLLRPKLPFALSETLVDFGDLDTTKSIQLFNNTDSECSYKVSNIPNWISMSSTQGVVYPESTSSIVINIDKNNLNYGEYAQTLIFEYSGKSSGTVNLVVKCKKVQLTTPEVSCESNATNLTQSSFTIKGSVEATGGQRITSYGHCWSLSHNPTIADSKTTLGSTTSVGDFISDITGLSTYTTYYVRAYAVNASGTSYSNEVAITTQDAYSDKWDGSKAKEFAGGNGSASNPYVIMTGAQLNLMRDYPKKHFVLANNINLDNKNWKPFEFNGKLDGKGFVISNLYINREEDVMGFFSNLGFSSDDVQVKNLTIKGVVIEAPGCEKVGALAGQVDSNDSSPAILNCKVILNGNSKINGGNNVGGIVGYIAYNSQVPEYYAIPVYGCEVLSASSANTISGSTNVGGIAGDGCCTECVVSSYISGGESVGGICGYGKGVLERNSFSGKVSGDKCIGGIVGSLAMHYAAVMECKASTEIVTESGLAGGIIGGLESYYPDRPIVVSCYATGSVSSSYKAVQNVGGIVGGYIYDSTASNPVYHSYTAMSTSLTNFDGMGYGVKSYDCCSTNNIKSNGGSNNKSHCTNITSFMQECYSEYSDMWQYNNTWTWTGSVNGTTKSVSCPKLAWE